MESVLCKVCLYLVTQLCLTVVDPVNCSLPGSSVHEILHKQEYWSELPFPLERDLLVQRLNASILYCR